MTVSKWTSEKENSLLLLCDYNTPTNRNGDNIEPLLMTGCRALEEKI